MNSKSKTFRIWGEVKFNLHISWFYFIIFYFKEKNRFCLPSFSSYTQNCNKIKDVEHSRRYDFWCKFCAHTYITGKVPSFITCLINYSDATKSDVTCFICHKCDAWICVTRLRRRYRNPSNFFYWKVTMLFSISFV